MNEGVTQFIERIKRPGRARVITILFAVAWLAAFVGLWLIDPLYAFASIGGSVVVGVFVSRPEWALYLMAVLYPFIHLEFFYGALNVPYVDAVGVLAFTAWGVRLLWTLFVEPKKLRELKLPLIGVFAAFMAVGLVSTFYSWNPLESLQYLLRPLLFFYLVFVLYVVNHMRDTRILLRVLGLMFFVGVVIALYGLYGYLTMNVPSFVDRRVTPVPIFGKDPLGGNHNLIADIMVTTIPIGFFFMMTAKKEIQQKLLFLSVLLLIGTTILTFSRSGWLALGLEVLLLVYFQYRQHVKTLLRYTAGLVFVLSPLLIVLVFFLGNDTYQSSNENRLLLNDVALEMFQDRPLFGVGPGNFQTVLETNRIYIEEFGATLDAHGFIQKVASELGSFGLLTFIALLVMSIKRVYDAYKKTISSEPWSYLLLTVLLMIVGAIFFQLFQTSYFVAKLWLPIGVALAAAHVLTKTAESKDNG